MTSKWYRKEEKQAEHPGQMALDFSTSPHPTPTDKSDTPCTSFEDQFVKETT